MVMNIMIVELETNSIIQSNDKIQKPIAKKYIVKYWIS